MGSVCVLVFVCMFRMTYCNSVQHSKNNQFWLGSALCSLLCSALILLCSALLCHVIFVFLVNICLFPLVFQVSMCSLLFCLALLCYFRFVVNFYESYKLIPKLAQTQQHNCPTLARHCGSVVTFHALLRSILLCAQEDEVSDGEQAVQMSDLFGAGGLQNHLREALA
jgi:hypothetical protein